MSRDWVHPCWGWFDINWYFKGNVLQVSVSTCIYCSSYVNHLELAFLTECPVSQFQNRPGTSFVCSSKRLTLEHSSCDRLGDERLSWSPLASMSHCVNKSQDLQEYLWEKLVLLKVFPLLNGIDVGCFNYIVIVSIVEIKNSYLNFKSYIKHQTRFIVTVLVCEGWV